MSASELEKRKPVAGFFGPANTNGTAFIQPSKGTFNDPTSCGISKFARDRTFVDFGFIAPSAMLNVRRVVRFVDGSMHVVIVVALIGAEVLLNRIGVWTLDHNGDDELEY